MFKQTILDLSDDDISAALDELDDDGSIYTEDLYGQGKHLGKRRKMTTAQIKTVKRIFRMVKKRTNRSRFKKGENYLDDIADQLADKFKRKDGDMDLEEVFDAMDEGNRAYQ